MEAKVETKKWTDEEEAEAENGANAGFAMMFMQDEVYKLAKSIAHRDREKTVAVLAEAYMLTILRRLERAGGALTMENAPDELERTMPGEVYDVLNMRLGDPKEFARLPYNNIFMCVDDPDERPPFD